MAHPQTNFSSNFQVAQGLDAKLDIKINGQSNEYRPSGGDQIVELIEPIIFEASDNPTYAEVNEAIGKHVPVYIHVSGAGDDYMLPYVGGTNDTGFRFAIPDTQTASLKYWVLRSDNTWVTGSVSIVPASGVIPGTYTKVTVNDKGVVTAGSPLLAADIPVLDASKITTGTFDPDRISNDSIEPVKLKYKKNLAVDGRTIQATEVGNTITLSTPEKLRPITRHAIYSVSDSTPCDVDIIDGEFEDISYSYSGTGAINLMTDVTTDCHAIMFIKAVSGSCGVCEVSFTDEAMNQRTISLNMEIPIDSGYLLNIDIRKITHNGTPYSIAKVSAIDVV